MNNYHTLFEKLKLKTKLTNLLNFAQNNINLIGRFHISTRYNSIVTSPFIAMIFYGNEISRLMSFSTTFAMNSCARNGFERAVII